MVCSFLWALIIFGIYGRVVIYWMLLKRSKLKNSFSHYLVSKTDLEPFVERILEKTEIFQKNIDSKYIGLIVFLNSNILTGVFNLAFNSEDFSTVSSLLIIILHGFISVGIACFIKDFLDEKKINSTYERIC